MPSRWKYDRPMSRAAFEARFPDEASCARHLAAKRWPDGFVCPACGHDRGWELKRRRASWECAACGKETSVTAGTIMHRSHLPLKTWLMAVHIVTSHSNGISALQLQAQLGLGSYKSAWLLLHKLRRAMVDPDRSLLEDLVEIDEATLPFRTVKDPTPGGQGRSRQGKMRIAGAVELSPEGEPRRIRLAPIGDFSARSLHAFVAGTSAPGARVITDGWSDPGLPDHDHQPKVVGATPAHLVLIWIPFSNLKRWALEPSMACAAPICATILTSSCSAGTAAATPQRPSTPCSASARASELPRHRRTTRLILAGRAPATARPPIRLNWSRIPVLQPA